MEWFWQSIERNFRIKHITVNSRKELVEHIKIIHNDCSPQEKKKNLWFRGAINFEYKLIPSLYRDETIKEQETFHKQISELSKYYDDQMNIFQSRVQSRLHHIFENHSSIPTLDSTFNWASIMQHYSAPSWLLDWSLNLNISIYFAIEHMFNKNLNIENVNVQPCVWVLNPKIMNQYFWKECKDSSFPNDHWIDNTITSEIINRRLPTFYDIEKKKKSSGYPKAASALFKSEKVINSFDIKGTTRPINLMPLQNTNRISTQKGMFTAFPIKPYHKENTAHYDSYQFLLPLDSYKESNNFLTCFILNNFSEFKDELEQVNFSPWDVYPEIGYRPGISY